MPSTILPRETLTLVAQLAPSPQILFAMQLANIRLRLGPARQYQARIMYRRFIYENNICNDGYASRLNECYIFTYWLPCGRMDGPRVALFDNGQINNICSYSNGRRIGKIMAWYRYGKERRPSIWLRD